MFLIAFILTLYELAHLKIIFNFAMNNFESDINKKVIKLLLTKDWVFSPS